MTVLSIQMILSTASWGNLVPSKCTIKSLFVFVPLIPGATYALLQLLTLPCNFSGVKPAIHHQQRNFKIDQ